MYEEIDLERLRNDLIDYYGTAIISGNLVAVIELSTVENASQEELIQIAIKNGFDLTNYEYRKTK